MSREMDSITAIHEKACHGEDLKSKGLICGDETIDCDICFVAFKAGLRQAQEAINKYCIDVCYGSRDDCMTDHCSLYPYHPCKNKD